MKEERDARPFHFFNVFSIRLQVCLAMNNEPCLHCLLQPRDIFIQFYIFLVLSLNVYSTFFS